MNFLLDRFPYSTYQAVSEALLAEGHRVALTVLTQQSKFSALNLPKNCFYDHQIARGMVTYNVPNVLSREHLEKASTYEGLAIGVFARYSIGQRNFSAQEMSSHYFELYNFWLYHVLDKKINFCFHHYVPHDPSSFVLYVVLKAMKIPSVYVDTPHIFNRYRFLSCSFTDRTLLLSSSQNSQNFDFRGASSRFGHSLRLNMEESIPKPIRFRTAREKDKKIHTAIKLLNFKFMDIFRVIGFILRLNKPAGHLFKLSRRRWSSSKSEFNKVYYSIFFLYQKILLRIKLKQYELKCSTELTPGRYLYFAMSAQPEGSTLPTALAYKDVFTVLRAIRTALPSNIKIVYKENPSMFELRNPYISAVNYRSSDYYDQILDIGNVQLVSTTHDSTELIKNAYCVATINGTVAIEAVHFGVPAITFGSNWYDQVDGILRFENNDDLAKKLLHLDNYHPVPELSNVYLDQNFLIEFDDHDPYEFHGEAREQLVNAFLRSVEKFRSLGECKWSI
ncbi:MULTISPECIES: capsular polysaccharide export protein, LipB/KpsS family [unclassified Roseobacter]|uniref:capsular polysaccharide export protein, LipB/KpsS family n=1 Tax=unclassified Roseobacter TaxID=196798 RepID=UPI0030ED7D0D